jgi:microcystin-dependent protein
MSEPFIGEIRMFGGNFTPRGWAPCNGQLLSIAQNTALFSILGTTFGGDGRTTFGLPDLRGRVPMHQGQGPGLTPRTLGESGGREAVALTPAEMPSHAHTLSASDQVGTANSPTGNVPAPSSRRTRAYAPVANTIMGPTVVGEAGGSQPHDNLPPFGCVTFIIAIEGIFPSRS